MKGQKKNRRDPGDLTDKIKAFRRKFEAKSHTGVTINTDGMQVVLAEIREIEALATEVRNELSALRWNAARLDAATEQEAALLAALKEPGSNVRLLSSAERPFSDGMVR